MTWTKITRFFWRYSDSVLNFATCNKISKMPAYVHSEQADKPASLPLHALSARVDLFCSVDRDPTWLWERLRRCPGIGFLETGSVTLRKDRKYRLLEDVEFYWRFVYGGLLRVLSFETVSIIRGLEIFPDRLRQYRGLSEFLQPLSIFQIWVRCSCQAPRSWRCQTSQRRRSQALRVQTLNGQNISNIDRCTLIRNISE